MRIGVTGTFSGGKDLVAEYLVSREFNHISTGDLVREEATKRGILWTRENLQNLGNILRKENGADYLTRVALTKFRDNIVVSGIRNKKERIGLEWLIFVDGPVELRYKWAKQRGKLTDDVDFETFKRQQEFEMGHEETGLQLGEVMAAADVAIWNDHDNDREPVYRAVNAALERFRQ